jgi:hypothetical protein
MNIASVKQINLIRQLIVSLIILVTLSLTRIIGVTINCFIFLLEIVNVTSYNLLLRDQLYCN